MQTTNFRLQIFKKKKKKKRKVQAIYHIENSKSVDLDEVAHDKPPHQDLRCLQTRLFSSLALKELTSVLSCHF